MYIHVHVGAHFMSASLRCLDAVHTMWRQIFKARHFHGFKETVFADQGFTVDYVIYTCTSHA